MFDELDRASAKLASVIARIGEHAGAMLAETEGLEHRQYATLYARARTAYEYVSGVTEELGRELHAAESYRARA